MSGNLIPHVRVRTMPIGMKITAKVQLPTLHLPLLKAAMLLVVFTLGLKQMEVFQEGRGVNNYDGEEDKTICLITPSLLLLLLSTNPGFLLVSQTIQNSSKANDYTFINNDSGSEL